jgi:hypothetical protein
LTPPRGTRRAASPASSTGTKCSPHTPKHAHADHEESSHAVSEALGLPLCPPAAEADAVESGSAIKAGVPADMLLASAKDDHRVRAGPRSAPSPLLRLWRSENGVGGRGTVEEQHCRPAPQSRVGGRLAGPLGLDGQRRRSASRPLIEPCVRFSRTRLTDSVHHRQTHALT